MDKINVAQFKTWMDVFNIYQQNEVFREEVSDQGFMIEENGFTYTKSRYSPEAFKINISYEGFFLGYPLFEIRMEKNRMVDLGNGEGERVFSNIKNLLQLYIKLLGTTEFLLVPNAMLTTDFGQRKLISDYSEIIEKLFPLSFSEFWKPNTPIEKNDFLKEFYLTVNVFLNRPVNVEKMDSVIFQPMAFWGKFDEKIIERFDVLKRNVKDSLVKLKRTIPIRFIENQLNLNDCRYSIFLRSIYKNQTTINLFEKEYELLLNNVYLSSNPETYQGAVLNLKTKDGLLLKCDDKQIGHLENEWREVKEENELSDIMNQTIPDGFFYFLKDVIGTAMVLRISLQNVWNRFREGNSAYSLIELDKTIMLMKNNGLANEFRYQFKEGIVETTIDGVFFHLSNEYQVIAKISHVTESERVEAWEYHQGGFDNLKSSPIAAYFKELI